MKEGHSEFWPWALGRWQGPAAERLLELQDEHDVVILELKAIHQLVREKYPMFKMNLHLLETYLQQVKFMGKIF